LLRISKLKAMFNKAEMKTLREKDNTGKND
jgi:hypothetical protein